MEIYVVTLRQEGRIDVSAFEAISDAEAEQKMWEADLESAHPHGFRDEEWKIDVTPVELVNSRARLKGE